MAEMRIAVTRWTISRAAGRSCAHRLLRASGRRHWWDAIMPVVIMIDVLRVATATSAGAGAGEGHAANYVLCAARSTLTRRFALLSREERER